MPCIWRMNVCTITPGWGHFSTVWLASDTTLPDKHPHKLVALKIQKSAIQYTEAALDEITLLEQINEKYKLYADELKKTEAAEAAAAAVAAGEEKKDTEQATSEQSAAAASSSSSSSSSSTTSSSSSSSSTSTDDAARASASPSPSPSSLNRKLPPTTSKFIVSLLDHFAIYGPHGKHICLVFEVAGKNLLSLIKQFEYQGIPIRVVKSVTKQILEGLDFLHTHCQIIHT